MGRDSAARHRKSIYDPVHGSITLEGAPLDLVGHPSFQRLWGIRQTGFAHLVFPGANHTRLEHSLGVYWVARTMSETLGLGQNESSTVAAGGLLHDIGHPPFSHTLEPSMREVLGHGHEGASRRLLTEGKNGGNGGAAEATRSIPEILERHRLRPSDVANLVDPPPGSHGKSLLRAMLHGAIDSDRIDYLQRDAHYTGVAHGAIDAVRLLDTVRERGGRLVFAEKGRSAVEGFLVGRALMYSSVYYHKTVRSAEVMAQAAVERLPGYPESARSVFGSTDGELLVQLQRSGGRSKELVEGLLARRLYKRAHGWKSLTPGSLRGWRRLLRVPEGRRKLEDEVSERLNAPPGSVLFDLAGLEARDPSGGDWDEVGVLEGRGVVYPFRAPSLWQSVALRPPTYWSVSAYVTPRLRSAAERFLRRDLALLP